MGIYQQTLNENMLLYMFIMVKWDGGGGGWVSQSFLYEEVSPSFDTHVKYMMTACVQSTVKTTQCRETSDPESPCPPSLKKNQGGGVEKKVEHKEF